MKVSEFFSYAISCGMDADPRGRRTVEKILSSRKKEYASLKEKEKEFYDKEKLTNPYEDSRILFNPSDREVKGILCGIDITSAEILLADRLKGMKKIDLVLAHHPIGSAFSNFYEVMRMQPEIHETWGVPINVAEGLLKERITQVEMSVLPRNSTAAVDAARLLDIPIANIHTPADNHVTQFLKKKFEGLKGLKVKDVLEKLGEIEEYKLAKKNNLPGPKVVAGDEKSSCGKIVVDMTGGTEPSEKLIEKAALAGVGTIIAMHFSEKHIEEAKKHNVNLIIAGHMSSDSIGLNLLFDKIERKFGKLEIFNCSGFTGRIRRKT